MLFTLADALPVKTADILSADKYILILLSDLGNIALAREEFEQQWISDIILELGADEDELSEYDKFELVEYFIQNGLEIVSNRRTRSLQISYNGVLAGELFEVESRIKREKDGALFYEVTFSENIYLDDLD